jgi:squalene-associated FAD-dependent desaturase
MQASAQRPKETRSSVAVVGGGWSGIAAAVELTRSGHDVTLVEMASQLGGRARRVEVDGLLLDNGQHILIGAYSATLALMHDVGVDIDDALLRMPLQLCDASGEGFAMPPGKPLVALARAVWSQRDWSLADKIALCRTAGRWALRGFECDERSTVATECSGLTPRVRAQLIDPLCVAALNTPAERASAAVFLRVLRDALFAGPGSSDLLLPRRPLSDLLPAPAARWLTLHGAQIEFGQRVESIHASPTGWQLAGRAFDAVVLAASAAESARLAHGINPAWSQQAASLEQEPIVTVYAHSPGTRLPMPMLALPAGADAQSGPAQFAFDLGALSGQEGVLAFVISAARPWTERGVPAIEEAVMAQAQRNLAAVLRSPLRVVRSLTDKRATFACVAELRRPPARIAAGLVAAGDYIAGPYPATLEAAVRSGISAAQALDVRGTLPGGKPRSVSAGSDIAPIGQTH